MTRDVPSWGTALARHAAASGLAVTRADGSQRAIPIGAYPVVVDDAEITRRSALAAMLVRATARAAHWRMAGSDRDSVLAELGPAERRLVRATWDCPVDLAVARVDFMGAPELPDLAALEVNATIPAMQAYSDIAAEAWLATLAPAGTDVKALAAANGSNTHALLDALVALYAAHRADTLETLGILCRRGDAQITELHYLQARFRATGLQAHIVHPDELSFRRGFLVFQGHPLQLVYRHLFLSRLDATPAPDIEAALVGTDGRGTLVLNRPAPHLEMKSTLAVLSRSASEPDLSAAIGLTDAEQGAIRATIPWTRILSADREQSGLDATDIEQIRSRPDDFVLKRSWSYGGNDVFVGRARETEAFRTRLQSRYPGAKGWPDLVDQALREGQGARFVVQRAIPRSTSRQWLCTPEEVHPAEVVTDYAAYASIGSSPAWTGVCRAATSDVVNIVGGGAVVPLIRRSVIDRLQSTASE